MPRIFNSETPNQQVNEDNMRKALAGVMFKGETPSCAARKYGLKRTTILYRLLRERKRYKQTYSERDTEADSKPSKVLSLFAAAPNNIKREPDRKFQSKFTTKQLLSAQQEEDLSNYLKQCYDSQCQQTGEHSLLTECIARNFVHSFVRMNNIRYPAAWDPKQQAGGDWFNGFVDRNPEVIEYVAPALKLRKRRRRVKSIIQKEGSKFYTEDSSDYDHQFGQWAPDPVTELKQNLKSNQVVNAVDYEKQQDTAVTNPSQTEYTIDMNYLPDQQLPPQFKVKIENQDVAEFPADTEEQYATGESYYNEDQFVPELVYQNDYSSHTDEPAASIAQSVKRRKSRKPRVIPQIVYPRHHIQRKDNVTHTSTHQDIEQQQYSYNSNRSIEENSLAQNPQEHTTKNLQETMEKMHSDMNRYMQAIIMEMMENNRLLKQLVGGNASDAVR